MADWTFSAADKVKCVEREVGQRKRVYARLVEAGRMSKADADREIACMSAVLADCREQVVGECLPLFPKKEARRVG